ncbi:hypothetical protein [Cylindrospermopsis raciborskii]|uniref:hypothetical protein n=1 Tax=Cylindrospermopsis raciborskii TaxID=77022 RepID=UPI002EDB1EF1
MSNKRKYKPGVKITMNKFNQLLMGTTTVVLTAVMLTSCGGGTSSNTGGGTTQGGGGTSSNTGGGTTQGGGSTSSNTGGGTTQGGGSVTPVQPTPTTPQTLTVTVPSLGYVQTIDKNTTLADITTAARDGAAECINRFGLSSANNTCQGEVRAAQSQAVNFINR